MMIVGSAPGAGVVGAVVPAAVVAEVVVSPGSLVASVVPPTALQKHEGGDPRRLGHRLHPHRTRQLRPLAIPRARLSPLEAHRLQDTANLAQKPILDQDFL